MQHIDIVCFGKLKEAFWRDAVDEYRKRLSAYCKLDIIELGEAALSLVPSDKEILQALDTEADNAMKHIPDKNYVIALCVEGRQMSSCALAEKLADTALEGRSGITFVIGSSYGLSDRIKKIADYKLSFSEFTFPHQLMRVILTEQLYRAYTIQKGTKYHK